MTTTQWILKLLSGPHAGAEMHLEERSYRVGRSEDCDVVIHDEMLPAEAFVLNVGATGIQLRRNDLSVAFLGEGQPIEAECLELKEYEIYSIGLLHFCFGTANSDWPVLKVPSPQPSPEDKNNPVDHRISTDPRDESSISGAKSRNFTGRSKTLINCSLFLFLVTSGVIFSNGRLDAGMVSHKPSVDLPDILSRDLGFPELVVNQQALPDQPERWLIDGYVRTTTEVGVLKQRLQSLGVSYELNVRVMESIKRSTETLLKQLQLNQLVVSIGEQPGELVISGIQQDPANWQRMKKLLLADIPGLTSISDRVESTEGRISLLKQWIREESLDRDVIVNAGDGRLTITSDIQLESSDAWQRIKAKFQDRFGGSIDLAVMTNNRPPIAIRSVSLGSVPYLVLANGRRYSQGSHVNDGYYLDQIHKDAVVLKRGNELVKYPVGPSSESGSR